MIEMLLDEPLGADAAPAIVMRETASEFTPPSPEACCYVSLILDAIQDDCNRAARALNDLALGKALFDIRNRAKLAKEYLHGRPLSDEARQTVRQASLVTDRDI